MCLTVFSFCTVRPGGSGTEGRLSAVVLMAAVSESKYPRRCGGRWVGAAATAGGPEVLMVPWREGSMDPDRSVAGWSWHRVKDRMLEAPVVGPLLFEPLQLHRCAFLDAGPQVCHETGRIFRGHDIASLNHRVEVGLPLNEELQVGGVLSV